MEKIELIKRLLEEEKIKEATEIAKKRDTTQIIDAKHHLIWADLLEEMGLIKDVMLELQLAIRDDPNDYISLSRLAEIYWDQGDLTKAVRCLNRAIDISPLNKDLYIKLAELFKEIKEYEKAVDTLKNGHEKTGDKYLLALIKSIKQDEEKEDKAKEIVKSFSPDEHHLIRFVHLFSGREGVYARQWVSPTGNSGYTPIHEPFTPQVAKNHILGNFTIGIYPLRLDNSVTFIAFDFDLIKPLITKLISKKELWDKAMNMMLKTASLFIDLAHQYQIPIYLENSGFKGYHLWIFLKEPLPGKVARKFGKIFLHKVGSIPREIHVEIFPKQGFVPSDGLGNLIKLPLGIHRTSGRRSLFIDPKGNEIENQLDYLINIKQCPKINIFRFIQELREEDIPIGKEEKQEVEIIPPKQKGITSIPKVVEEYDIQRDKEVQYLLLKCEVLRAIVDKIFRTRELTHDERLVITHTIGLLSHGVDAVNSLFKECINIDAQYFLKSRLKGNPISCAKIRKRIPEITTKVSCNCLFDLRMNLYPTPLLHLNEISELHPESSIGGMVDSMQFQMLLQQYLKVKRDIKELEILIDRYEKRLNQFFEQAGVDEIKTPWGRLKRIKDSDEKKPHYFLDL